MLKRWNFLKTGFYEGIMVGKHFANALRASPAPLLRLQCTLSYRTGAPVPLYAHHNTEESAHDTISFWMDKGTGPVFRPLAEEEGACLR